MIEVGSTYGEPGDMTLKELLAAAMAVTRRFDDHWCVDRHHGVLVWTNSYGPSEPEPVSASESAWLAYVEDGDGPWPLEESG
jgi:hypothetical protein